MPTLKIILIGGVAFAGVVATLMIQRQAREKFQQNEAVLQAQEKQIASMSEEHERLVKLSGKAKNAPPADHTAELAKLRAEAEALKKQTNDLDRQLAATNAQQPTPPAPATHTPEYWQKLHEMAGTKSTESLYLARAFSEYAWDHKGECPTNLDQLVASMARDNQTLSGTNQFEIIYHGSFDDLKGIPFTEVAVVREQQAWPGPDGRMFRVYGMGGGMGQIVSSDDNFASWEAKHVILPSER